jgi:hypothetical protein
MIFGRLEMKFCLTPASSAQLSIAHYTKNGENRYIFLLAPFAVQKEELYRKDRLEGEGRNTERREHKGYFQPVFSKAHPQHFVY